VGKWVSRTAIEIASAVRSGDAKAHDVVAEHLRRIENLNPELGAFVRIRSDKALREADEIDARADLAGLRLAGVPVAIKDNLPVSGEPMRFGSAAVPSVPQQEDHPVVARLRAAGAVVVGLTNLPELAIYPLTDSAYGIARNPWDKARTPGGSSGGAAAAVAAGMVPLAQGNDGLGSIRIPSAACGLVGIKPGLGVVPALIGTDSWHSMSENGPLATTVADAALMLEVMAGASFRMNERSGLRVAISIKPPGPGVMVHHSFTAAVKRCGELLANQGHNVQSKDPPYPLWATPATIARWFTCAVPDALPLMASAELETRTRRHVRAGQFISNWRPPRDSERERLRSALGPFFEDHDVLVMPSLGQPCPRARRWGERSWLRSVALSMRFAPMTGIWNLAGYPAASVPTGPAASGLPGSVQLVSAPGREDVLLAVAAELERAYGWSRHSPTYTEQAQARSSTHVPMT
jgi:amidase